MGNRTNEPPKTHFRSGDRCFKTNGEWYFATREGVEVGPYRSREAAAIAAGRLIKTRQGVHDPIAVQKVIREFMFLMGARVRMP